MAPRTEVVLRQRVCRASGCGQVFWTCRHCDRGQHYCSHLCRQQTRRQQHRLANRRHQQSPEGRQDHRDRQRAYRRRHSAPRVTDVSSPTLSSAGRMPLRCALPIRNLHAQGNGALQRAPRLTSLCPLRPPGTFRGTVPPNLPEVSMLSSEQRVQIRHWFYAEHWKVGTIAQELGVHPDTVRHALDTEQFNRAKALRPLVTDPYVEFLRQTLQKYPRLRATRIYQMIRERGYTGSVVQLRRVVARLRPVHQEPFL